MPGTCLRGKEGRLELTPRHVLDLFSIQTSQPSHLCGFLEAFQGAGKRTYDALLRRGMGSEPPIIAIFGLRMHRDGVHRVQRGAGRLV
jgi:hypothetical protein